MKSSRVLLLVDDDPDILRVMELVAAKAGFVVVTASDGETALDVASALAPDLIVLDVGLPARDGRDVLRQVRRDPRTAHTPVLMLTASSDEHTRRLCFELGADDYVEKPFPGKLLVQKIEHVLWKAAHERAASRDAPPSSQRSRMIVVDRAGAA